MKLLLLAPLLLLVVSEPAPGDDVHVQWGDIVHLNLDEEDAEGARGKGL